VFIFLLTDWQRHVKLFLMTLFLLDFPFQFKCFILKIRASVWGIGVGAGKFLGAKDFLPKFPQSCFKNTPN